MTKNELISTFAEANGLTKVAAKIQVESLLNIVATTLGNGDSVELGINLGKFVVTPTAARQSRNPKTKEVIEVPASRKVAFKPSKALKESVKPQ